MTSRYTARYTQYARSQGLHPDCQAEADKAEFPGGKMTGFMIWVSRQLQLWEKATGSRYRVHGALTLEGQRTFDAWLAAQPNPVHTVCLESPEGRQFVQVRAGMREDAVMIARGFNQWATSARWVSLATTEQAEALTRTGVEISADRFETRPTWANGDAV